MVVSTNQTQPRLHSVQVLAAEILDHFMLARDQSVDQTAVVIQHVRASEEPALSGQPRDPPQPARLSTHSYSPTRSTDTLSKNILNIISISLNHNGIRSNVMEGFIPALSLIYPVIFLESADYGGASSPVRV